MLRTCHWAALLAICFWVGYVAAAPLPGVQWSRLSVWEASALADVWARSSEYLDFRSYALCGLSDLGYLDHLLGDFAPTSGALSVSGTACRPRRDPPGVPRGYRGSGPMVSGV